VSMFRQYCFVVLSILVLQSLIISSNSTLRPTSFPSLTPTTPTKHPTHRPTHKPTISPTRSPTVTLDQNEDIKIVVNVSLSGDEVNNLCNHDTLKIYEHSLVNVFIAASGVAESDIEEAEITECKEQAVLFYELRSNNPRAKNTVTQRVNDEQFLMVYQKNLDFVFESVTATSVYIVEAGAASIEKSSRNPFANFLSPYFGLGVVIFAVSALWCLLLRAEEGDTEEVRLKQLREEKRKFEQKYGSIEEDSLDHAEVDPESPRVVEMADTNTTTKPQTFVVNETVTVTETVQVAETVQAGKITETVKIAETVKVEQSQAQNDKDTETKTTVYRASVVAEVKHVTAVEEKESIDLDQIKDPGNKRRKTQEYLNNLWDDKSDKVDKVDKVEEDSEDKEDDKIDETDEDVEDEPKD